MYIRTELDGKLIIMIYQKFNLYAKKKKKKKKKKMSSASTPEEMSLPLPSSLKAILEDDCFWILRRGKVAR